ncbi:MAG TPA: hypothetical protein VK307_10245 [Thermoleophilaceae bacterium]|nr:hypothetical protein [Thermoleophilaceae bacterium]
MEPRDIALSAARGRIGFGVLFTLLPSVAGGRLWLGPEARQPGARLAMRALGGRDIALGLGAVIALDRGSPVRGWLEAAAFADAVDAVATLLAGDSIPRGKRRGAFLIAAGSAVTSALLARALDPPPERGEVHAPEAAATGHPSG